MFASKVPINGVQVYQYFIPNSIMDISHSKNESALRTLDFLCAFWGGQEFISRLVFVCFFLKENLKGLIRILDK